MGGGSDMDDFSFSPVTFISCILFGNGAYRQLDGLGIALARVLHA